MTEIVPFAVGDGVIITDAALQNIRASNRNRTAMRAYTSDSFLAIAEDLHARQVVGVVTHIFPPGYEVSVDFAGQGLHAKHHFIERATLDPRPPRERLADFAKQIEQTLAQGKMPNTNFFFASLINAIRENEAAPTVVLTVENGMAEVTGTSGPVRVVIADMDRNEDIEPDTIDAILDGIVHEGSASELSKALQSAREGLDRFKSDDLTL
ncbi:hypothetical protein [Bosea sp. RAC05]|uniref:hypothetical protein n=1 Tax=Bosea sp. RAC05 TaxID=1842539 RepID=UPI00083E114F|nr:hypothetical protein [Bosea sp. RAC05]AOG03435.1 hypothetical protein BSY19_4890 [Bosea sp. RAC05]